MDDPTVHQAYTDYVQEKFFKTGVYTHLFVDMTECTHQNRLVVKWTYTFQDLGMTHIISRTNLVDLDNATNHICVDGVLCSDLEEAEKAIFQGHYAEYLRDLYESEGIITA